MLKQKRYKGMLYCSYTAHLQYYPHFDQNVTCIEELKTCMRRNPTNSEYEAMQRALCLVAVSTIHMCIIRMTYESVIPAGYHIPRIPNNRLAMRLNYALHGL
jgi:hypothetical protein